MKGNYLNLLDRRIRNIFNKLARSAAAAAAHRSLSLLFAALTHTQSHWMEVHSGVSEEEEVLPLCNPSWCSPLSARQQSAVVLISMLMGSLAKLWKNIPMWGFRDTWIKTIYAHLANKAHVKMLLTKQKHRHIHTWFLFCLSACVCVRSLFETLFPRNDSLPNCPNYCTSCGFILKHADMFLTELYTDLLPNVSDTNPLPSFDTHIGSCWCTTHLIHRYRKPLFTACSSLVMTWFESSF